MHSSPRLSRPGFLKLSPLPIVVGGGSVRLVWSPWLMSLEDSVPLAVISGQTRARFLGRHQLDVKAIFSFDYYQHRG